MRLSILILVALCAGCAHIERTSEPVVAVPAASAIVLRSGAPWQENLRNAALLSAMVYGATPGHERIEEEGGDGLRPRMPGLSVECRLRIFAHRGLHAAYVAPRLWLMPWIRYPELYVLGDVPGQTLSLVFVGTNSATDWYQNIKTNVHEDDGEAGDPYIPSGHAGFRRGVGNLISEGFFTTELPQLASDWGIRPGADGRIPVFLAGHSLGAAVAPLCMPVIDGWRHVGTRADDGTFKLERVPGLFEVRGAFLIAPPYAIASDEFVDPDLPPEQVRRNAAGYGWMVRTYGQMTWNVMHEADVVCSIYDIRNIEEVSLKHFGRLVRIDGSGKACLAETTWGDLHPHDYWGYWRALRTLPP